MKLRLWIVLASSVLALLASAAGAQMTADQYLALRRQNQPAIVRTQQAKADPAAEQGKFIELRGTLSGVARQGEHTSFIINCSDASYVVSTTQPCNIDPGCGICVLARLGDSCKTSLSDLILVAVACQGEVEARERKALEADAAKRAAQKRSQTQAASRFRRGGSNASRSGQVLTSDEFVAIYKQAIRSFNRKLSDTEADTIARSIIGFAVRYEVDPRLVVAVMLAESGFRPLATSRKGAMGLGQLMPRTAAGLGVSNAYDPVQNIDASIRLIRGHLDKLSGGAQWTQLTWQHLALALASYNAGSGAVRKYGGIPPYRETRNYINKIFSIYRRLCGY